MASALPGERAPSRILEERTVDTLRRRGLLQLRPARRLGPAWLAGAVAASLVLFASGVVFGQWLSARSTTSAIAAISKNDALRTAAQVQRAGTQYVTALQALAQFADSTNHLPAQGREVALAALYAAANEVVRLAPNDPMATEILRGFQRVGQPQNSPQQGAQRLVVWY